MSFNDTDLINFADYFKTPSDIIKRAVSGFSLAGSINRTGLLKSDHPFPRT